MAVVMRAQLLLIKTPSESEAEFVLADCCREVRRCEKFLSVACGTPLHLFCEGRSLLC